MHDIQSAPFQGVGLHTQITAHVELSNGGKTPNKSKISEAVK